VYRSPRFVFAVGFWLWSILITVLAGYLGTMLNCESGEGCKPGFPSWFQPWSWGDYYVYPQATIVALSALIPATIFVVLVAAQRQWVAAGALVLSITLLSYAYFGGLTSEGRAYFWFGPFLGLAALGLSPARGKKPLAGRFVKPS
jgi:hypothetical protein